MTTFREAILCSVLFVIASVSLAMAQQGTYTQIDIPGHTGDVICVGINLAGDIVGYYDDGALTPFHGFLLTGGAYTTLDYPTALHSFLTGVNDNGQIVGIANELEPPQIAFLYDRTTAAFTTLQFPTAQYTAASGINNNGFVVGTFSFDAPISQRGFKWNGAAYAQVDYPNSQETVLTGVSSAGEIVGYSFLSNHNFIDFTAKRATFTRLLIPNARGVVASGISPDGTAIVGRYQPTPGIYEGFVYQNSTLTPLQFPGSSYTWAFGINNAGEVAGFFYDSAGIQHGFLWTPPADLAGR